MIFIAYSLMIIAAVSIAMAILIIYNKSKADSEKTGAESKDDMPG